MEYFIILMAILLVTIFIEWKYHIHLYHSMRERIIVTLNIFVFGMMWDYYALYREHWVFPGSGLIGLRIYGLPIEEFLFFLILPYAAFTMYKFYDKKIK